MGALGQYEEHLTPVKIDAAIVGPGARHFRFTDTSAEIIGNPSLTQYLEAFAAVWRLNRASPWWLADLARTGEQLYGESFSQALEPYAAQTLANYASVAAGFEPHRRRTELSFGHHEAVRYGLSAEEQDRLLGEAARHGWNRQQLREEARQAKRSLTAGGNDKLPPTAFRNLAVVQDELDRMAPKLVAVSPFSLRFLRAATEDELDKVEEYFQGLALYAKAA